MRFRTGIGRVVMLAAGAVLLAGASYSQDLRNPDKRFRVVDGRLQEVAPDMRVTLADSLGGIADSLTTVAVADSVVIAVDVEKPAAEKKRVNYLRDSIPLSRMCWISAVLPGYGQLYNKQAWKIPVIYAVGGTSLYFMFQERNQYRHYKGLYDSFKYESAPTDIIQDVQTKMIQHNTRKQIFMVGAIATYVYSIADAALSYKWYSTPAKKATTLSTILPGAGQFYNKSYWKVPIVLGGLATMAFVIDWNQRGYERFKTAYDLRYAAEQSGTEPKDEFAGMQGMTLSYIKEWKNNYRRNRDLCIIIAGGLYLLNIVEANVDASLKDYDISDMIAMEVEPRVFNYSSCAVSGQAIGLGINIRF